MIAAPEGPPPRPGRRMLLRSALAALLIALFTAGASATAGLMELRTIIEAPRDFRPIPSVGIARTDAGKPQTLLLLGSDARWQDDADDPPRSDTLMLVRLDPEQRATTVLSIPRDLRVGIPGHGPDKINEAYAEGGPQLALDTVKKLTGLEIHHVLNVNFKGFRGVVNLFGCFYTDVDRRYFHSNVGVPVGQRFDAIDLKPGYQELCGHDALDYVRYRHGDSDITRAARQQDFLRAAKDQVSTSAVIDDRKALAREFAKAVQTDADLRTAGGFIRLSKLALASADDPVRQIAFPAQFDGDERRGDFVKVSAVALKRAVRRFLTGGGKAARKPSRPSPRRGSVRQAELVEARERGRAMVARLDGREDTLGFPIRFPSHVTPGARYVPQPRVYSVRDRAGTLHRAYRLVLADNEATGQFYGVQGTAWRNPPLLAEPSARRRVKGRTLELFRAGRRLRFVAWRTDRAAYWISNTLGLKLSNDEMLALAANLTTP